MDAERCGNEQHGSGSRGGKRGDFVHNPFSSYRAGAMNEKHPKITPIILDGSTLGGLLDQSKTDQVGGLDVVCWTLKCRIERERLFKRLDLEMLVARFGRDRRWRGLKLKCQACAEAGRDPYWTEASVHWTGQAHVTGHHPGAHTPKLAPQLGHNNPPKDEPWREGWDAWYARWKRPRRHISTWPRSDFGGLR